MLVWSKAASADTDVTLSYYPEDGEGYAAEAYETTKTYKATDISDLKNVIDEEVLERVDGGTVDSRTFNYYTTWETLLSEKGWTQTVTPTTGKGTSFDSDNITNKFWLIKNYDSDGVATAKDANSKEKPDTYSFRSWDDGA